MTMRAIWNGAVLAESDKTVVLEGVHYFPRKSLRREFFAESGRYSVSPWKGVARYYTITVNGESNPDAAWFYPEPTPLVYKIKNRVAFWRGIEVVEQETQEQETPGAGDRCMTWL